MATLTSAGITFSDSTTATTAGGSAANYGYQKLGNGIIIQMGSSGTAYGTNTFPIAFPTACAMVKATLAATGSSGGAVQEVVILSKSTSNFVSGYKDYASAPGINGINWIAIGY